MAKTQAPGAEWRWIPSLYFAQAVPYVIVMTVSVVMYKNLGVSNTEIALYTAWLYLPWVIKPLWSPLVDLLGSKRTWIVALQFLVGAALALVALTVPAPGFFQMTLAVLWLMAFSSATHDIAADGFYMIALAEHRQAAFVGVRSAFYRVATIAGQGGLVYFAGRLSELTGSVTLAWSIVFSFASGMFLILCAWHALALPRPSGDLPAPRGTSLMAGFAATFARFFRRKGLGAILAFLLLFRFAEAQALKMIAPFLLDPGAVGGLGLTTSEVGIVYGAVGAIALTLGGLLGGLAISRHGLRRWLWPMVFAVHVPNLLFVYLALAQPASLLLIAAVLVVEQFGYGFGFAAYLLFMIMVAQGPHQTAHYAICTGFMALGMMLPGMASGWIQESLGYASFFAWVCVATIPAFVATAFVDIDPEFGRRGRQSSDRVIATP